MKSPLAFAGVKLLALLALALAGCGNIQWPPGCTSGDYACLPCNYPQSTNPSCAPFPTDAKKKKGAAAGAGNGASVPDRR